MLWFTHSPVLTFSGEELTENPVVTINAAFVLRPNSLAHISGGGKRNKPGSVLPPRPLTLVNGFLIFLEKDASSECPVSSSTDYRRTRREPLRIDGSVMFGSESLLGL